MKNKYTRGFDSHMEYIGPVRRLVFRVLDLILPRFVKWAYHRKAMDSFMGDINPDLYKRPITIVDHDARESFCLSRGDGETRHFLDMGDPVKFVGLKQHLDPAFEHTPEDYRRAFKEKA